MTNPGSLAPKPFVFVLMPFDAKYKDIYKFGIRGAAEDVGAYAERLDEQIFVEGMLDRIFNQISKADVIVADMTGRNPNVFYEVGYAHALGKIVILLTQDVNDIPFDFKHRQHIVYGGQIDLLRQELSSKLQWAINEAKKGRRTDNIERFSLTLWNVELRESADDSSTPALVGRAARKDFVIPLRIRNDGFETILGISHVYLFAENNAAIVPSERKTLPSAVGTSTFWSQYSNVLDNVVTVPTPIVPLEASAVDAYDGLSMQFRLKLGFPTLPPGAVEVANIGLIFRDERTVGKGLYRLRLHTASQFHEYRFRLDIDYEREDAKAEDEHKASEAPPSSGGSERG